MLDYFDLHFLTEAGFAAMAGWSPCQLQAAVQDRLVPGPSYRLAGQVHVTSFLDDGVQDLDVAYHLTSHLAWIGEIQRFGIKDEAEAKALFMSRYEGAKRIFAMTDPGAALIMAAPEVMPAFDEQHAMMTWDHFLNGVYGSCTRNGAPETIFCKQVGVRMIEALIRTAPEAMPAATKALLTEAVDFLDQVVSGFAPHERARSSRQRCIDDVRACYLAEQKDKKSDRLP